MAKCIFEKKIRICLLTLFIILFTAPIALSATTVAPNPYSSLYNMGSVEDYWGHTYKVTLLYTPSMTGPSTEYEYKVECDGKSKIIQGFTEFNAFFPKLLNARQKYSTDQNASLESAQDAFEYITGTRFTTPTEMQDISSSFTDPYFKQVVWEWLGHPVGTIPGRISKYDLKARMPAASYTLEIYYNPIFDDPYDSSTFRIKDLSGIENFEGTGIQNLICMINKIDNLPYLPSTLKYLNCQQNKLSSLPELPSSLEKLDCSFNQLNSLPALPGSLQELDCQANPINSLPALPSSLQEVNCYHNQLRSLPTLPSSLRSLLCTDNPLGNLPDLPASLQILHCDHDQLSSLPPLPDSLKDLWCSANQLGSLPAMPGSLQHLDCRENQLSNLPDLPSSLQYLDCNHNQLSSLPTLPSSLQYLDCRYNQLSSLPALPSLLHYLQCSYNHLDVNSDPLKTMLDKCPAHKIIEPQY